MIASSVRVLPLRVADPDGGPPWGLRVARTSRGLLCVEVGRVVGGRIGVLGRDGAFHDDGAFHPFAENYLPGRRVRHRGRSRRRVHQRPAARNPRQRSARQPPLHLRRLLQRLRLGRGLPARPAAGRVLRHARTGRDGRHRGGCRRRHDRGADRRAQWRLPGRAAAPGTALPAGSRVLHAQPWRPLLHLLPHAPHQRSGHGGQLPKRARRAGCPTPPNSCNRIAANSSGCAKRCGREHPDIYAKLYRAGRLRQQAVATLSPHQIAELQAVRGPIREPSCPDVGFVAPSGPRTQLTASSLASPVSAHLQRARRYCERNEGESLVPCDRTVPRGYKPLAMKGPPELLLTVNFTGPRGGHQLRQPLRDRNQDPGRSTTSRVPGRLWRYVRPHADQPARRTARPLRHLHERKLSRADRGDGRIRDRERTLGCGACPGPPGPERTDPGRQDDPHAALISPDIALLSSPCAGRSSSAVRQASTGSGRPTRSPGGRHRSP